MDALGHLAGAVSFNRVGFLGFSDQYFTGGIQNLFYPPFHDFLLGGLLRLGFDPIHALKVFECGVIFAYFFILHRLTISLRSGYRYFFYFLLCAWIYREKTNFLEFQGLGAMDFFVTGLLSQFLGALFFFGSLLELRKAKPRKAVLVALVSLSVLSHLIMGFCSILLLIFHEGFKSKRAFIWTFQILLISG